MKRVSLALIGIVLCAAALAPRASADFGLSEVDVAFLNEDGTTATQAGSHPFAMQTRAFFKTRPEPILGFEIPDGSTKDLFSLQIPGLIGKPGAVPACSTSDFLAKPVRCPASTQVGINNAVIGEPGLIDEEAVYSVVPPPGVPMRLGVIALGTVPVTFDLGVDDVPPYRAIARLTNVSQVLPFYGTELTIWGTPADPAHDPEREGPGCGTGCAINIAPEPFLTVPRACEGPLQTNFAIHSWLNPDVFDEATVTTHDASGNPQGFVGCAKLGFTPEIDSKATADSAETGTGLDFSISFKDEGLTNPDGIAQSDIKKTVVTLPEGVTVNPSIGEGLGACSPAQLKGETVASDPGEGCPNSSKIGTVKVETELLEVPVEGSVYLAQQDDPNTSKQGAENPFDSLLAFYIVLQNKELGISIKLPAKVEPDPLTGQLITTVEDIPQLPFSKFDFHFREGQRAPLVSPPTCGSYETVAELTPWARPDEVLTTTSSFQITQGIGDGPCPPGGIPPFSPGFEAGSLNNNAGSYSPFYMRLIREDGEQDMTKFSSVLPPGVVGKLAGLAKCPDANVALAKLKTGREELAAPSCPVDSQIGRTLAGAGVGSALTYVGGQLYLAGPYNGAPLSVVSITPAVAGPFDAGTVVVRIALKIDPRTAEVEADGAASDPIPHILKGIPLKVRDLRVYVDRPSFILNPTSCDESSARATLFGGFLNVFSPLDDVPVNLSTRYQAANCLNLGFKPRLSMSLKGGTKRGDHPSLRGVFRPRPGDANLEHMVLRLPRSAFLDQSHIRTICTRVQFAAEACPKGAVYGKARAFTPLLDTPLEGPVYLRSSDNNLPDFVAHLRGIVDVEAVARIDSEKGGIRVTFEETPDAPISKVIVKMQGGKKGTIVNSRNLCAGKNRAKAQMEGHNGKRHTIRPVVRALGCKKKGKKRTAKRSSHSRHSRIARAGLSGLGAVR